MRDLSQAEYRTLAEFRYQIRRFLHFSEEQARAVGLEPQQHQLLLAVHGLPRTVTATVSELAERLQLKHHSVVELIDRLERRGYVTRNSSHKDRRQVLVHLTGAGSTVLRKLSLAHHMELETAAPALARVLRSLDRQQRAREKQSA
jgi:DNA-binding MarR family transcriptional regulator